MLSILSKIFTFLFISSLSVGFSTLKNKTKIHNSFFETCAEGEIIDEIEKENSDDSVQNPFPGTPQTIYLNTQVSSYYSTPYTVYFTYTPIRRAFTKLNYSGAYAHLTIYYFNYYSSDDYLTYVEDVGSHLDCYYFDRDTKYLLEFTMYQPTYNGTLYSFTLTEMDVNTPNKDNYILHQTMDSLSSIKYHYEVEYSTASQTSSTMVDSVLVNNATYTNYDDVISSTLNFDINNDNRRVVANTEFCEHSAVAKVDTSVKYYAETEKYGGSGGSAAFVSENIAVSCAHLVYKARVDNADVEQETNLSYNLELYPGINSYQTGNSISSTFGKYVAVETYLPISYILAYNNDYYYGPYGCYNDGCVPYDWCVIVTECTTSGSKTHSTMGYNNFTSGVSQYPYARVAGYPGIVNCPESLEDYYESVQWTNYPLEGNVSISGNSIITTSRIVSGGNSGGPMFVKLTTITNGQVSTTVSIIGICSGAFEYVVLPTQYKFCRMRHQLVNIISEVVANNV